MYLNRAVRADAFSYDRDDLAAGFTLLETLIALTVACILSIGVVRLSASTAQLSGRADRRFEVATLSLQIANGLPKPGDLGAYSDNGIRGDLRWNITSAPLAPSETGLERSRGNEIEYPWQPYRIVIEIRSGADLLDRSETIRLGRPQAAASP